MQPLEEITVGGLLRRTAERFPNRPALTWRDEIWSYARLDAEVDRYAAALHFWGLQKGDRLGIWCEAEPHAIFLMYAAARMGAVTAMLNTSLSAPELKALLQQSDIRHIAIGDGYRGTDFPEICRGLQKELPLSVRYIGLKSFPPFPPLVQNRAMAIPHARVLPSDPAFLLYTSGTTSLPKAVLDSHFSRANSGIQQALDLGATEEDRFCVAMPIFHCFCLTVNVMAACACGGCLCLPDSRRTESLLRTVQTQRCTVFSCVPTLFHALLARPDLKNWDLRSLRVGFIGGSTYSADLFRRIEETLGMTLLSSLGQTEATAGVTTTRPTDPFPVRAETIGRFLDHLEGKIACPATGKALPPGQTGEICIRGYMVMRCYDRLPEETARVIDPEGWLHTGDLGQMDKDGYIRYAGRLKDLIIRAGENISPREIEEAVQEDPRIRDCRAVGVPDEHYGEEVCLCVIAASPVSEEEIRARLKGRLSEYKIPRYILFLEAFPATQTGKVSPAKLRAAAAQALGLT